MCLPVSENPSQSARYFGQDRDILQHGLAAIAKTRRLDGGNLQTTAQAVDYQRRKRLAFDIFCDDD